MLVPWTTFLLLRGVAVAPRWFQNETADQKCSDVVSGVGTQMGTEFRPLSAIVMVARVFLEVASNFVRWTRFLGACCSKSDGHIIGPSDDAFEEEPGLSRLLI